MAAGKSWNEKWEGVMGLGRERTSEVELAAHNMGESYSKA